MLDASAFPELMKPKQSMLSPMGGRDGDDAPALIRSARPAAGEERGGLGARG